MARQLRINFDGAYYHVTNRGARKQRIFVTDDDRHGFLDLLGDIHRRYGVVTHSYCLMTNHFHLVMQTPEGNLSRAMHRLGSVYVQRFNRRNETDGPLFKDRFYSKLIDTDGYVHRAVIYVMRNPLEAGMVSDASSYPWSSYSYFLGHPGARPEWLSDGALKIAGISTRAQLRRAVTEGRPGNTLDMGKYPQVIGSDSFIAGALKRAKVDDQTIGHARQAAVRPSFELIESAISSVFDTSHHSLITGVRGRGARGIPRIVAVGLAQELGGASLAELANRYGFGSAQSAGVIASRFRRISATDDVIALRVEQVRRSLLLGGL
ncbi:MAG: putative transposase [Verrucomicrobiales bacterium]